MNMRTDRYNQKLRNQRNDLAAKAKALLQLGDSTITTWIVLHSNTATQWAPLVALFRYYHAHLTKPVIQPSNQLGGSAL